MFTIRQRLCLFSTAVAMVVVVPTFSMAEEGRVTLRGIEYRHLELEGERLGMGFSWVEPLRKGFLADGGNRVELEKNSREIRLNGVRTFLGEPVRLHERALYISASDFSGTLIPVLAPPTDQAPLPHTIVIDPGHGGKDTGAENRELHLQEKDLTLAVSLLLRDLLVETGFNVVMTREDDRFVPLSERAELAIQASADLFLSIHFNAVANGSDVHGTETYIMTPENQRSTGRNSPVAADNESFPGNAHDGWNMVAGFLIHRQLVAGLASFDRGLKRARFVVLREADCPAVLIEAGYLSNPGEAGRIATAEYQDRVARSVMAGVLEYRDMVRSVNRLEPGNHDDALE